jgi:glycosyltransferase involved in cell wall biosynthesis
MRIAYLSESVPPLSDGVTRTLCQLVETLHHEGVDFLFLTGIKPSQALWWTDRIHSIPSVPFLPYSYYRLALPYLPGVKRLLDGFEPDLVHVVNPTLLGIWGQDYARARGLPVVSSYHTRFVSYFPYYGLRGVEDLGWKFLTWFYNRCDVTYAPSPTAASELRGQGVERIELWQRGIDHTRFSPACRDWQLRRHWGEPDVPVLLFVGRLVREKDLDDLVEAARVLRDRGQRFRLVLVGDGPMRPELEQALPEAHFAGHLDGDALSQHYASADVFVFPSTTETFGNVILEAFASGLPAVGVRAGGVQDLIVPDVNGLLSAPRDGVDFADKIEALFRNRRYAEYLRAGALRTAAEHRWDAVNRGLIESYHRVLTAPVN